MSANKFTERLTRDNATVVLVDHQVGLYSGVRDIPVGELKHNVVALATAAQVLGLPLVVTTTAADSMWGPVIPELAEVLPEGLLVIDRSTVNAWDDPRVVQAIRATGRNKLIITGISTEVCLALPCHQCHGGGVRRLRRDRRLRHLLANQARSRPATHATGWGDPDRLLDRHRRNPR
jgi:isochorismate hydrolase